MELRQLHYFTVLAEELHFTRAAARLHLAQSALSSSIQALERELDALLVVRDKRGLALTDAGQALLREARRTLAAADAARGAVDAVKGVVTGTLTIGYMLTADGYDLAALLGEFHRAHPGVRIRLFNSPSAERVAQVQDGRVDLAFSALGHADPDGVEIVELVRTTLPLLCPPGHPLVGRDDLGLDEIASERFIDFVPGWGIRTTVDEMFRVAGLERGTAFEANDIPLAIDLVTEGLGVAFVPDTALDADALARTARTEPAPLWRVAVVHPHAQRMPAAAQAFLKLVEERLVG